MLSEVKNSVPLLRAILCLSDLAKHHAFAENPVETKRKSPTVPSDLRRAISNDASPPSQPENGQLQATWSSEQIVGRLRQEGYPMVRFKPIYRLLYTGRLVKGKYLLKY